MFTFYEFFAGGGMVRAGLGKNWSCLFANDFDPKKTAAYKKNWGKSHIVEGDVAKLLAKDLPDVANLIWASFPCQDLSLAGKGTGLRGERSGTFWPFWSLLEDLVTEGREPDMIVLENVCGTLNSHNGEDFEAISTAIDRLGYNFGAMVIDAAHFVPQSRPRLFIVCVHPDIQISDNLLSKEPSELWHNGTLRKAQARLPKTIKNKWLWWKIEKPKKRNTVFADLLEDNPSDVNWHSQEETDKLLGMMSQVNLEKVNAAKQTGKKMVGCLYKRTRHEDGKKKQRAEVRFDDIAGCLRTPAGGSSRQLLLIIEEERVRSRLISSRETARLMGLPDDYKLPVNYNEAYKLTGDGVVVSVVHHLAVQLFEPILEEGRRTKDVGRAA